ncbi:MAG: [protein-PII] uridylyltransferase [Deltaproteobacteria bacterium]|nr:[protein-PII] uridylyltransferase [Deltaproteobacteria bacterium]
MHDLPRQQTLRERLTQHRDRLRAAYAAHATIAELLRGQTTFFDALLALEYARLQTATVPPESLSIVAIGGYGRSELSPHSDLDLLFLAEGSAAESAASALLYALWDGGVEVTGVVRSLADCEVILRTGEIRAQTALLDARSVAGGRVLWEAWQTRASRLMESRRWQQYFVRGKRAEMAQRRQQYGGSPFLLEPNVKESEGGLRDWQTAWWIGRALHTVTRPEDLVGRWCPRDDWDALHCALDWLLSVRWGLHTIAGRKQDRFGFDQQTQLAAFHEGDVVSPVPLPPEAELMRRYYAAAATVRDMSNWCIAQWCRSRWQRRYWAVRLAAVSRPWAIVHGTMVLRPRAAWTALDIEQCWQAIAQRGAVCPPETRYQFRRLHQTLHAFTPTTGIGRFFRHVGRIAPLLREMHRTLWLERFIPELTRLRYRMQRDAYHCYTIDMHLIETVAQCEWLLTAPPQDLPPHADMARRQLEDPLPVVLAALLHDIGKGRGRPHAQEGARLAGEAAQRWRLPPETIALLQFLVRSHQLMSRLAFTRDLTDAVLIEQFADTVASPERLSALFLLTLADIRAVGPKVYSPWKGELLGALYARTYRFIQPEETTTEDTGLRRQALVQAITALLTPTESAPLVERWIDGMPERYLRQMSPEEIAAHVALWYTFGEVPVALSHRTGSDGRVTIDILAHDAPRLFAKICGVLAARGMNIVEAHAFTGTHHFVIDRFLVLPTDRYQYAATWDVVQKDLADVIHGYRQVAPLIDQRRRGFLRRPRRISVSPAVTVDNAISEDYTVFDIQAHDRLGLLAAIAEAIYQCDCHIVMAKVLTIGERVQDAFYVQKVSGEKMVEAGEIAQVTEALRQVVREG